MSTFLKKLSNFLPKTHYQRDKEKIDNLIKSGNIPNFDKNTQMEFMLGINTIPVFSKLKVKHLEHDQLHFIFDITRDEFFNILSTRKFDIALTLKNKQDGLWITDRENLKLVEQERGRIIDNSNLIQKIIFIERFWNIIVTIIDSVMSNIDSIMVKTKNKKFMTERKKLDRGAPKKYEY